MTLCVCITMLSPLHRWSSRWRTDVENTHYDMGSCNRRLRQLMHHNTYYRTRQIVPSELWAQQTNRAPKLYAHTQCVKSVAIARLLHLYSVKELNTMHAQQHDGHSYFIQWDTAPTSCSPDVWTDERDTETHGKQAMHSHTHTHTCSTYPVLLSILNGDNCGMGSGKGSGFLERLV